MMYKAESDSTITYIKEIKKAIKMTPIITEESH